MRHYYNHHTHISITYLYSNIVPDIETKLNSQKKMLPLSIVGIVVGMLTFMLTTVVVSSSGYSGGLPFTVPVGMFLFMGGGIFAGLYNSKKMMYTMLSGFMGEIRSQDKTVLLHTSIGRQYGAYDALRVAKKLIDTGNLVGYEILDGETEPTVVKKSTSGFSAPKARVRETDVIAPTVVDIVEEHGGVVTNEVDKTDKCIYCGTGMRSSAKFCPSCGKSKAPPKVESVHCAFCGTLILPDAKFCDGCGQRR